MGVSEEGEQAQQLPPKEDLPGAATERVANRWHSCPYRGRERKARSEGTGPVNSVCYTRDT